MQTFTTPLPLADALGERQAASGEAFSRLLTLLIPAVMRRAQGLPIRSAPEQCLVSTMWHLVVHH